jgi:hypothetical protein
MLVSSWQMFLVGKWRFEKEKSGVDFMLAISYTYVVLERFIYLIHKRERVYLEE